jgi:hypothetical protein
MAEKGGQEGNTNSTADKRLITSALRRVAAQNPDKLKAACEKLMDDAVEGNIAAFNVFADRMEGKPAQSIGLGDQDGNPLQLLGKITLIKPDDTG